jgi:2-amino-4-hydroxy-6-hydroxymethyldihydropteridine diphosphokinase
MPALLIGLGANLGDRQQLLQTAVARLAAHPQIRVVGQSRWYETSPVGGPADQSPFLNGAVLAETPLDPPDVLGLLQQIEHGLGRQRRVRWGPRSIDLDLLLYDQLVLRTPSLSLPHPRMAWRRFVLEPAAEVAASMVHPTIGWTIGRLLDHLNAAVPYVVITGPLVTGKRQLAKRVAEETGARLVVDPVDVTPLETIEADPAGKVWPTEFNSSARKGKHLRSKDCGESRRIRRSSTFCSPRFHLKSLDQRARLLTAKSSDWSEKNRLTVSDFWLDQSLALARVWLDSEPFETYRDHWERCRHHVVRPKLIVLWDVSVEQALQGLPGHSRRGESGSLEQQLEQIRQAVLTQANQPEQGPLLQSSTDDPDEIFQEVLAAVQAMQ